MKDYMENAREMLKNRIVNYKIEIEVLKKNQANYGKMGSPCDGCPRYYERAYQC